MPRLAGPVHKRPALWPASEHSVSAAPAAPRPPDSNYILVSVSAGPEQSGAGLPARLGLPAELRLRWLRDVSTVHCALCCQDGSDSENGRLRRRRRRSAIGNAC